MWKRQGIPLVLTVVVCAALIGILGVEIVILNQFTATDISLTINWVDILVGLTIYLKTSIDFAIYIGHLMGWNVGWKSRVAIEVGTAFGNAAGTMIVLLIWTFFKEVRWLLALMILLAALVLFKLAEESLEHAKREDDGFPRWFQRIVNGFDRGLGTLNKALMPVLKYVVPNLQVRSGENLSFRPLFILAFSVPFVLGLDDFAGYVPLFSVINVFGFGIGVFVGHMFLNILLYLSPERTIQAVKNPIISFIGCVAFVGLGVWGLV